MLIQELEGFLLFPTMVFLKTIPEREWYPVGIITATSASFAAGYTRYAPDDVCPDVRLGA
jgi:hypothetical protein